VTCRTEILEVARYLVEHHVDKTFLLSEIMAEMHTRQMVYADRTITNHVVSKMCANAPAYRSKRYLDLERVGLGRYRLLDSALS